MALSMVMARSPRVTAVVCARLAQTLGLRVAKPCANEKETAEVAREIGRAIGRERNFCSAARGSKSGFEGARLHRGPQTAPLLRESEWEPCRKVHKINGAFCP